MTTRWNSLTLICGTLKAKSAGLKAMALNEILESCRDTVIVNLVNFLKRTMSHSWDVRNHASPKSE